MVSSSFLGRSRFLIRSIFDHHSRRKMHAISEDEAANILRAITPRLSASKHKGQAGKIAVIGGSRDYTGAPYFASISALKIGADLSHVFCTKDAAPVIKSYSPELIVHPFLEESHNVGDRDKEDISGRIVAEIDQWMDRFDCIVVGPGLGRDAFLLDCVGSVMKKARQSSIPLVIDGDGLFLITEKIDLVQGYPLAILTPNVNEYKRLVQKILCSEVDEHDAEGQLLSLAKQIGRVTILCKGNSDLISDGEKVDSVSVYGSPRRCGGQGDILSGSVAVFLSWARQSLLAAEENTGIIRPNPMVLGCIAGSALLRKAALLAFEQHKRSTLTSDIIKCLGKCLEDICPA